jgi:hypothetical protein
LTSKGSSLHISEGLLSPLAKARTAVSRLHVEAFDLEQQAEAFQDILLIVGNKDSIFVRSHSQVSLSAQASIASGHTEGSE